MVEQLTKDNFDEFIKTGKVIVDFYADWCGPCQMMKPIFEEVSKEMTDVKFGKVNTEDEQDLSGKFQVMSIPSFVLFKDGEKVGGFTGGRNKQGLIDEIEKVLK
tara:strand:- start:552 stop:863 length:312 start_codon:yes stop_codon:yes gene_type:complete